MLLFFKIYFWYLYIKKSKIIKNYLLKYYFLYKKIQLVT